MISYYFLAMAALAFVVALINPNERDERNALQFAILAVLLAIYFKQ